jgi:hypothetical protein
VTQTTVLPDQTDESVESGAAQSPSSTNPASRDDIGAALLRLNGEESPASSERQALNGAIETGDSDPGNAADTGVNPDEKADTDEPGGSRRTGGTQRTIAEMKAEIDALKAKIEAPQAQQSQTETQADDPVAKAQEKLSQLRGSDEDWQDLKTRVVDGLSFEDAERYRRMQVARDFEDEYQTLGEARASADFSKYRNGFFESVAGHFSKVSTKPGIDPEFVTGNPDMGAVFDHIYEAGRKDLADENERLKGEIKQLKAQRLETSPRLPTGGRSSIGLSDKPDPREASPSDLLSAGIRQRSGVRR